MRIGFALQGSRGDIQPAVGVAADLTARGHEVTLSVPENLVEAVSRTGMATTTLCPDTAELLASPLIRTRLKSRNPVTRMKALREVGAHGIEQAEAAVTAMADSCDLLVTGPVGQERAASLAESRGIAFRPLHFCPVRPNRSVSPVSAGLTAAARGGLWRAVDLAYWSSVVGSDRRLRRSLDLHPEWRPLSDRLLAAGTPQVQAYDPAMFTGLAEEWGPGFPFTGFLTPDAATLKALNGDSPATSALATSTQGTSAQGTSGPSATDRALDWIHVGPPPVYMGFGSMPVTAEQFDGIVSWLVGRGVRVLAHTRTTVTPHPLVYAESEPLDHEQVLPPCAGAVHHGGAGTTAAATRAGLPSVIGWFSADQPLWARALAAHGAGTGAPLTRVTPTHLEILTDDDAARRARALGARLIDPETAVANASTALTENLG